MLIYKKYFYFFFIFIGLTLSTFAQQNQIIEAYNLRFIDSSKSIQLQQKIYKEAVSTSNTETELMSNCFLSLTYLRFKKLPLSQKHIENASLILPKITNNTVLGYYYYALYRYKLYIDVLGYENDLLKALDLFEKSKNYDFAALAALGIANSGATIDVHFLEKATQFSKLTTNNDIQLETQICNATYLKEKYQAPNSKLQINQVFEAYQKAIVLAQKPTYNKMNVAVSYLNYANFLVSTHQKTNEILPLIQKALYYAEKFGIVSVVRNCYGIRGLYLLEQKKYDQAALSFKEGIQYLKKLPFKDYPTEKKFYQDLKLIAMYNNNYKQYYEYDLLFQEATTLANESERESLIQNATAKYDLKSKEEKITLLSKENQLKDALIIASLLAILLGAGMFFYYYKNIKMNQKYFEQNRIKLEKEKQQTQKELMNSVLHLEKKNEILNELKDKLLIQNKEQNATINNVIFKTIDEGLVIDDDFQKFKNNFNTIYPEFFDKLQQKASNNLTQLDLKYCGFILMKVTNKEMASQMNVEPKSIRMARYRIKQKLNLSKEEDLDEFIQNTIE